MIEKRAELRRWVTLLFFALLVQSARALLPGPIGGNLWVAQGGAPIWNGNGGENSGAIQTLITHPTNPDILFIGTVNGGIWRTFNATATCPTWTPLTDFAPSLSISALTADPTDSSYNTIIAGLASYSSLGHSGSPVHGLLRTVDGGSTWNYLDGGGLLANKSISGVIERGNVIVVSADWVTEFLPSTMGIFRSTNYGASFTQVSTANAQPYGLPLGSARALVGVPMNPNLLYTAYWAGNGSTNSGIYKSSDLGATWSKASNTNIDNLLSASGYSGYNLSVSVGAGGVVYVGIQDSNSGGVVRVFRSIDSANTWTDIGLAQASESGSPNVQPGGGGIAVYADPNNPNIVYVGGQQNLRCDLSQPVGSQWARLAGCIVSFPPNSGTINCSWPHEDSRNMALDADGNLILACDGGVFRRTNPTNYLGAWASLNGTLQIGEYHDIAYDALFGVCVAGTQDCGTQRQVGPGQKIWSQIWCCDGHDVAVDTRSIPGNSIVYASYSLLGGITKMVYNSSLGLVTNMPLTLTVTNGSAMQGQAIEPLKINYINPNRLAIGAGNSVYESLDQGNTAFEIGPGLHTGSYLGGCGLAYGGYRNGVSNPDVLYVAATSGVFVRTNAGGTLMQTTAIYPGGTPNDVALLPTDWMTFFVQSASEIYMSINAGASWTNITGNLTDAGQFHCIRTGPTNWGRSIFVGTDLGVFISSDPNLGFWSKVGTNLPNAPVCDIEYNPTGNILLVGTLGRGAWMITNVSSQSLGSAPPAIGIQPQNQSVLIDSTANINLSVGGTHPFSYQWYNSGIPISGATNAALLFSLVQPGDSGGYYVVIHNSIGSITSSIASLTVTGSVPANCSVSAPSGLVSWWPGDGSGADRVGTNNGTLHNGVGFAPGEVGQAFSFDGVADYVTYGNQIGNFGTNDFSIEFWIKTSSPRKECILSKRLTCNDGSLWNVFINAGYIQVEWEQDSLANNYLNFIASKKLNDSLFHHVVVMRTNKTALVYCDGALAGSQSTVGITSISNSSPMQISYSPCLGNGDLFLFTGYLDDIRIYSRKLTLEEIQSGYATGTNGMCPPSPLMFTGYSSYSKSNGFVLNASLRSSQNYRIQANTNLATTNWLTLTNFTANTAPVFHFTNNAATNFPQRFYRIVSP